jgi:hypothetical protein
MVDAKKIGVIWIVTLVGFCATFCRADTFAVVVCGISKDVTDQAARNRVLNDIKTYLLGKAGVERDRLRLLTASGDNPSTALGVAQALGELATQIGPHDRFVFWYTGQANAVGGKLRLNLPGPDVTHEELASKLRQIKAATSLVVLDCPNAALAVKTLSGPGRVILCASAQDEPLGTQFSKHFVAALAAEQSDTDKDGKVSVLEAFTVAARQIEQWYNNRQILPTETPCLDDNGDGLGTEQPWRRAAESSDGDVASKLILGI